MSLIYRNQLPTVSKDELISIFSCDSFSIVNPVYPYIIDIIGFIIFKKAKGKNTKGCTPKAPNIKAPQVFHGIRAEVRVPESSRHLERFLG